MKDRCQKRYSVYDSKTEMPLIIYGTSKECAKAMGVTLNSFYRYLIRVREGKIKLHKWLVYEDEVEDLEEEAEVQETAAAPTVDENAELKVVNEKRLIDANALIADIAKAQDELITNNDALWQINQKYYKGLAWAHRLALDAPTVDAVEVVHGKWDEGVCTHCSFDIRCLTDGESDLEQWVWVEGFDYCPNCGAKMDGGNEDVQISC